MSFLPAPECCYFDVVKSFLIVLNESTISSSGVSRGGVEAIVPRIGLHLKACLEATTKEGFGVMEFHRIVHESIEALSNLTPCLQVLLPVPACPNPSIHLNNCHCSQSSLTCLQLLAQSVQILNNCRWSQYSLFCLHPLLARIAQVF
jgi:hypothetical protein